MPSSQINHLHALSCSSIPETVAFRRSLTLIYTVSQIAFAPHAYLRSVRAPLPKLLNPCSRMAATARWAPLTGAAPVGAPSPRACAAP
eukprot:1310716-Pleurochrysis_carterae.AAC.1